MAIGRDAATTRRAFLRAAALVGGTLAVARTTDAAGATAGATGPALLGRARRTSVLKTIVVSCQENHSFDHFVGSDARLPAGYGIPRGWQNSGVRPFHFSNRTGDGVDPNHDWVSTHRAVAGGTMRGFVANGNGRDAMGYYTAADLPYYYSLLPHATLCAEYFCGVLTETLPNRMVLYAGTSGGITDDVAPANGSLTWPCITHLLHDAGVTYANYNVHAPANYSYLCLWKGNHNDPRLNRTTARFFADCRAGTLPNVVWIERPSPFDEHPPASIRIGEALSAQLFAAIQGGPQWARGEVAILHTYDEGGGYFDHRPPRAIDAFGSGVRVPMLVLSPHARHGHVDTTYSDHGSVLKLIEHVFGLPTLASVNHAFDRSTPRSAGQGRGAAFPPRDGSAKISDLTQCFSVAV
jgi:phospholipase C